MPRGAPWDDPGDTSLYLKRTRSSHGSKLVSSGSTQEASSRLSASDLSQALKNGGSRKCRNRPTFGEGLSQWCDGPLRVPGGWMPQPEAVKQVDSTGAGGSRAGQEQERGNPTSRCHPPRGYLAREAQRHRLTPGSRCGGLTPALAARREVTETEHMEWRHTRAEARASANLERYQKRLLGGV
jgi:hypothetical protein